MRVSALIAVLVLSFIGAPLAQSLQLKSNAPLNLRLNSVTVGEALGAIERVSGVTIRIADAVPAATLSRPGVNLTFRDAVVIDAINAIAGFSNLVVTVADESTVLIQPKAR